MRCGWPGPAGETEPEPSWSGGSSTSRNTVFPHPKRLAKMQLARLGRLAVEVDGIAGGVELADCQAVVIKEQFRVIS
ncbi:MAG: hypothetical protein CM1200mP2_23000 [Planctomycetaceae bacterium]|nr:MAG: hypothetical protein CM1200mP2_23000 [Planctomycetaceae bacterium]